MGDSPGFIRHGRKRLQECTIRADLYYYYLQFLNILNPSQSRCVLQLVAGCDDLVVN